MQIIIPMSGIGKRFQDAGYKIPKPLIEINQKPIIAHILDMFPGETNFKFICNSEHLEKTNMKKILGKYCPNGEVISIEPHKLGPVYAVSKIFDSIDSKLPTIINYCDFCCYWNYEYFKKWINICKPDGCIPAYKGFHPHSLRGNNYAFMRVKDGWMEQIKEKEPFTRDKINEFTSSGTYYFANGKLVKKFFSELISKNISINNEFYCSMVYNLMIEKNLKIAVYELQHFMQWGTPEDFSEYLKWSNIFEDLISRKHLYHKEFEGTTLIPLAGKGNRFKKENYNLPKPMIKVSGKPMVIQAIRSLPKTEKNHFIALQNLIKTVNIEKVLRREYPKCKLTILKEEKSGQAMTCLSATTNIQKNSKLTISACDHGVIYDENKFTSLLNNDNIDIIIWVTKGHASAINNPEMYGWVKEVEGKVKKISVKKPLNDPSSDPIVIGTFTFKNESFFNKSAQNLIKRNEKINGEFYVDSCINDAISLGYKCHVFYVNHYLCWGTPNDLKTFEYWQSCFHKYHNHPYAYELDIFKLNSQNNSYPEHIKEINPAFLNI